MKNLVIYCWTPIIMWIHEMKTENDCINFLELREEIEGHSDDSTTTEDTPNARNVNLSDELTNRKRSQTHRKQRRDLRIPVSMATPKNHLSEPSTVTTIEAYFDPDEFSRKIHSPILVRTPTTTENEDNLVDYSLSRSKTLDGLHTQSNFHQTTPKANDKTINEHNSTDHDRLPARIEQRHSSTSILQSIKSRNETNENVDPFFD